MKNERVPGNEGILTTVDKHLLPVIVKRLWFRNIEIKKSSESPASHYRYVNMAYIEKSMR